MCLNLVQITVKCLKHMHYYLPVDQVRHDQCQCTCIQLLWSFIIGLLSVIISPVGSPASHQLVAWLLGHCPLVWSDPTGPSQDTDLQKRKSLCLSRNMTPESENFSWIFISSLWQLVIHRYAKHPEHVNRNLISAFTYIPPHLPLCSSSLPFFPFYQKIKVQVLLSVTYAPRFFSFRWELRSHVSPKLTSYLQLSVCRQLYVARRHGQWMVIIGVGCQVTSCFQRLPLEWAEYGCQQHWVTSV